tara:strand:+ start:108 stop:578 length:471 start_codon:yes stop_codon:yes gene_type:complete
MVGTQSAIIGAPIVGCGIEFMGGIRRFVVASYILIVLNIIGDQDLRPTMLRAAFEHKNTTTLKNNFGIDPLETNRAQTQGEIVISVLSSGHLFLNVVDDCVVYWVAALARFYILLVPSTATRNQFFGVFFFVRMNGIKIRIIIKESTILLIKSPCA